jgi:hypothetical protein
MGGGRGGSRRALARSAPDGLGPLAYFSTFLRPATILTDMLVVRADGFVDRCIPSLAHKPPSGPDWVHEVKHDGYRLIVRRDGETVRLFTRRGLRLDRSISRHRLGRRRATRRVVHPGWGGSGRRR